MQETILKDKSLQFPLNAIGKWFNSDWFTMNFIVLILSLKFRKSTVYQMKLLNFINKYTVLLVE